MFIHWAVCVPAGDGNGQHIAALASGSCCAAHPGRRVNEACRRVHPVHFDADAWATLAAQAGQVPGHHRQTPRRFLHCLDSQVTEYSIVEKQRRSNVTVAGVGGRLPTARREILFYYSQTRIGTIRGVTATIGTTTRHEGLRRLRAELVKPQVRELLSSYGRSADLVRHPKRMDSQQSRELVDLVHSIQPDCSGQRADRQRPGRLRPNHATTSSLVRSYSDWEVPAHDHEHLGLQGQ